MTTILRIAFACWLALVSVIDAQAQVIGTTSNPPKTLQWGIGRTVGATLDFPCLYDRAGVCNQIGTLPPSGGQFQLNTGAIANFGGQQSVAWQGAGCLGTPDETAVLTGTASAAKGIVIPTGCVLRVASTATISVPVTVMAGGMLKVDGVTLILAGGFDAPIAQVITTLNNGAVKFAFATQKVAYPEWWAGLGATDYLAALQASQSSGTPLVLLEQGDYPISAGWVDGVTSVEIRGVAGVLGTPATRVLLASATGNIFTMGAPAVAGATANAASWQRVRNITFQRTVAPNCSGFQGNESAGPSGFVASMTTNAEFDHISSVDSCNAFLGTGTIQSSWHDLVAVRTLQGANSSTYDYFYAYNISNYNSPLTAGGNASLFFRKGLVSTVPGLSNVLGMQILQPTDTFIDELEINGGLGGGTATCMNIIGSGTPYSGSTSASTPAGSASTAYKTFSEDVRVSHPVCDQVANGITITGINEYGSVFVHNPYVALSASAAGPGAAFHVNASKGNVSIKDEQGLGWFNRDRSGNGIGLLVENSSGVRTEGLDLSGFARPEIWSSVDGFVSKNSISVPSSYEAPSEPLIVCQSCQHGMIEPLVRGASGAASGYPAINLDTNSAHNEVHLGSIVANVVANKLTYGSTAEPGAGTYGTDNVVYGPGN